jgi:hypothetical protein
MKALFLAWKGLGGQAAVTLLCPTSQKKQSAAHHSDQTYAPYSVAPSQLGVPTMKYNGLSTLLNHMGFGARIKHDKNRSILKAKCQNLQAYGRHERPV